MFEEIGNVWFNDFKSNQFFNYFFGTRIGHSVSIALNIGEGVVDLVKIPIEEYQRGGSVLKGIGRGTTSLATTLTLQLVSLGVSGSSTLQKGLQNLNNVLIPQPKNVESSLSTYANQPSNILEGIYQAVNEVVSHTNEGFSNIITGGVRNLPSVVTEPAIGLLGGISKLFLGVQNSINPNLLENANQKYKQQEENKMEADDEFDSFPS